ncbi:L-rhamnose mutarotase [Paenibacillus sp. GCM10027626]|uniref:L-rhamnose mutarotase n=1 Tax=Paenibacillus sp. GCM10027626 TaxID=3273411 RepID=UPI00363F7D0C
MHANAWPAVLSMIKECNIRNYSIYYKDGFLLSVRHAGICLCRRREISGSIVQRRKPVYGFMKFPGECRGVQHWDIAKTIH